MAIELCPTPRSAIGIGDFQSEYINQSKWGSEVVEELVLEIVDKALELSELNTAGHVLTSPEPTLEKKSRFTNLVRSSKHILGKFKKEISKEQSEFEENNEEIIRVTDLEEQAKRCTFPADKKKDTIRKKWRTLKGSSTKQLDEAKVGRLHELKGRFVRYFTRNHSGKIIKVRDDIQKEEN